MLQELLDDEWNRLNACERDLLAEQERDYGRKGAVDKAKRKWFKMGRRRHH